MVHKLACMCRCSCWQGKRPGRDKDTVQHQCTGPELLHRSSPAQKNRDSWGGAGLLHLYHQYSHTPLWVPCPDPLRGFHASQLRHEKGSLDIIFLCHTVKYLKRTFTSCPLASLYCCPLPLNYAHLVACYEIENHNNLKSRRLPERTKTIRTKSKSLPKPCSTSPGLLYRGHVLLGVVSHVHLGYTRCLCRGLEK